MKAEYELIKKFNEIRKKGWIEKKSKYNNSEFGLNFEKMIGKNIDYESCPDFKDIEIKTKLIFSKSSLTLFSISIDEENGIKRLIDQYGYKKNNCHSFRGDLFYGWNKVGLNKFYLEVEDNKLVLKSKSMHPIISWDIKKIEERLYTKTKKIALVYKETKKEKEKIYYRYYWMEQYILKDKVNISEMIKNKIIYITMNAGEYIDKNNQKKILNHGNGFRISTENLNVIYNKMY